MFVPAEQSQQFSASVIIANTTGFCSCRLLRIAGIRLSSPCQDHNLWSAFVRGSLTDHSGLGEQFLVGLCEFLQLLNEAGESTLIALLKLPKLCFLAQRGTVDYLGRAKVDVGQSYTWVPPRDWCHSAVRALKVRCHLQSFSVNFLLSCAFIREEIVLNVPKMPAFTSVSLSIICTAVNCLVFFVFLGYSVYRKLL